MVRTLSMEYLSVLLTSVLFILISPVTLCHYLSSNIVVLCSFESQEPHALPPRIAVPHWRGQITLCFCGFHYFLHKVFLSYLRTKQDRLVAERA